MAGRFWGFEWTEYGERHFTEFLTFEEVIKFKNETVGRLFSKGVQMDRLEFELTSPVCDKCGRSVRPWPLKRGARCSPVDWAYCIRNDGAYGAALEVSM